MKIKGRSISGPNIVTLVIPRPDEDVVFKAQAVLDADHFEAICPEPVPPGILAKDGVRSQDFNDRNYLKAKDDHSQRYMDWMIIQSLKATEGLEWETVIFDDPSTFANYKDELKKAGFNTIEIARIVKIVLEANSLDETKYKEARDRFTHSQAQMNP
jgi:hypothetical protein